MNERMLELYRQAQVPHTAIDPSNNMPYETTTFSAEKFSELIVRECMDVAVNRNTDNEAGYVSVCREHAAKQIAEHFGVEE